MEPTHNCSICMEPVVEFAFGPCEHRDICALDALRLRALCNDTRCPFCKADLPSVVVTQEASRKFDSFQLSSLRYDRECKAYFVEEKYLELIKGMRQPRCPVCPGRPEFQNAKAVITHLSKEHQLHYCTICLDNRKVFFCEQKLYSKESLEHHIKTGDVVVDGKMRGTLEGHPPCDFCKRNFYSKDELFDHMRKNHYLCDLCERDGARHQYYRNYRELENHFRRSHFLCEEGDCLEKKFVVFRTDVDLKAHQVEVHLSRQSMSRAARGLAAQLPLTFTYLRPNRAGEGVHDSGARYEQRRRPASASGNAHRDSPTDPSLSIPRFVSPSPHSSSPEPHRRPQPPTSSPGPGPGPEAQGTQADGPSQAGLAATQQAVPASDPTEGPVGPLGPAVVNGVNGSGGGQGQGPAQPPGLASGSSFELIEGQSVPIPTDKEEIERRNKALVKAMKARLDDEDKFKEFRDISIQFRKGALGAHDFFSEFVRLFGPPSENFLFPELVALLPSEEKRRQLIEAYRATEQRPPPTLVRPDPSPAQSSRPSHSHRQKGKHRSNDTPWAPSSSNPWQRRAVPSTALVKCAVCGLQLLPSDAETHAKKHRLPNSSSASPPVALRHQTRNMFNGRDFPALGEQDSGPNQPPRPQSSAHGGRADPDFPPLRRE